VKIFLDTNVWVSALMAPGICEDLLFAVCRQGIAMSSPLVWEELVVVLQRRVKASEYAVKVARLLWLDTIRIADTPGPAHDPDARLAAAAAAAGADLFVTGDKRVIEWGMSGSMRIVSPRDAWIILFEPQLNR
jgi:predicted nucleic acid-binding protein